MLFSQKTNLKDSVKYARRIKAEAKRLGFASCGISKAEFLEEEAPRLENFLKQKYFGRMAYLDNHFEKRLDPRKLVDGAQSVISLSFNYYNPIKQTDPDSPKISMYAFGEDYHRVVKEKLLSLFAFIEQSIQAIEGRIFVDSGPVLERAWAARSGLGWIGKNGMLIQQKQGSFYFLAQLIIDLELETDKPIGDYCGNCRRCIDACPTQAIIEPKVLQADKCISYFTIELRDSLPDNMKSKFDNWMFGCDVCQLVCPWNRFSVTNLTPDFQPSEELLSMRKEDWVELTREGFNNLFPKSAVKRTRFEGLKRNIRFLQ